MKVHVSEVFDSIQGEGTYTGTPMRFIRLAGCSVGRHPDHAPADRAKPVVQQLLPILETPAWTCWTYDGRAFCCDTDFAAHEEIDIEDTIRLAWEDHVCLTGGEPMIHEQAVYNAYKVCYEENKQLHIETSGTKPIPPYLHDAWVTISPKLGVREDSIARANEIKLLVDDHFRIELVPQSIMLHRNVFVQPINMITSVNRHNLLECQELLMCNPHWKLSVQLHKYIGVR